MGRRNTAHAIDRQRTSIDDAAELGVHVVSISHGKLVSLAVGGGVS
jgi:hypothetical protein